MDRRDLRSYFLVILLCAGAILPVFSAPPEGRKYLVKSNNPKKVFHKQVTPIELQQQHQPLPDATNNLMNKVTDIGSPSDISGGNENHNPHPLSFLSNSIMQLVRMFFGIPNEMVSNGLTPGSDKMDGGQNPGQGFSWGQVIGYGLKLIFAALGGTHNNLNSIEHDGVDKIGVEGGPSPAQGLFKTLLAALVNGEEASADNMAKQTSEFINLTIALMNALKQSFSQRALRARSLGEKDKFTDLTLAAIDMGKAYAKTFNATSDACKERQLCEAARECVQDVGRGNAYGICHLSAYATANLMYYTQGMVKDNTKIFMEAARKGRSHQDCKLVYSACNDIQ